LENRAFCWRGVGEESKESKRKVRRKSRKNQGKGREKAGHMYGSFYLSSRFGFDRRTGERGISKKRAYFFL